MATGGRKTQFQAIHQISQRFGSGSFGTPANLSGVLGVLPAGAIMGSMRAFTLAAFNSTTNTMSIGTTPGGAQLLSAFDLKTLGRSDAVVAAANAGPFAVDTPIYYTLAFTGAVPTPGGFAVALIDYLPGPG
jgi:hypothetical protein